MFSGIKRRLHVHQRTDPLVQAFALGGAQHGKHPGGRLGRGDVQGAQQRDLLQVHLVAGAFGQCLHHVHAKPHQLITLLKMQGRMVVGEQVQISRDRRKGQERQQATGNALHESSLMK